MASIVKSLSTRARVAAESDQGFGLIEVLVSAVIVVLTAIATLGLVDSSTRASAEQRHYTRAYGISQDDQARLRSLKISELANIRQSRNIFQDDIKYTVTSRGEFVTDSTGTASCTQTASADYIKITSEVKWSTMGERPPVTLQSIVAPPSGSVAADHGALAVAIQNGEGVGVPDITVTGSGPDSFTGTTNENGCVIFGDLPEGDYQLTPSVASGLVNKDGLAPSAETVSVVGLATNTVVLQYDVPGSINVNFTTKVGSTVVASQADSIVVFNTGMTEEKSFGSVGTLRSQITASPLFPFSSPDTVYAGACTTNNPNPEADDDAPGAAATASVDVPAGGTATATVQLPAMNLTVRNGTGASSPGSPINGARVRIYDLNCLINGRAVVRSYVTNSSGQLADRGVPWSDNYVVCADNGTRLNYQFVDFNSMAQTVTLYVNNSTGFSGTCPASL